MSVQKRFNAGDSLLDEVTANYLNSIEERLARLDRIVGEAPITVQNTKYGISIGIEMIKDLFFVQLDEQLDADGSATANRLFFESGEGLSEETDSSLQVEVFDICSKTSLDNTRGLALQIWGTEERYIFVPWPLAQGDDLPNYDKSKHQALTHAKNGWLEWIDINICPDSSSGE